MSREERNFYILGTVTVIDLLGALLGVLLL
jgi:hypothetical protein